MKGYGQFCPIAMACETFAERWTPLILRELLNGGRRFNEIRMGLPLISRTLLGQRLRELEAAGVIQSRPLPSGRLSPWEALAFGLALLVTGLAVLALTVTMLATMLAFVTLVVYLGVYTPMKRRTPLSTLVGAVPGALPPLIGWSASHGTIAGGGAALFAIVFLWQIPHFMAIAWLYRDDYRHAGFPMLPVVEPEALCLIDRGTRT